MFKKILGVLLSLLVLLFIIVAMAPAKTILSFLQEKLPSKFQSVQFYQVEGSIWSPKIEKVTYKEHQVNNVALDLELFGLIAGKLVTAFNVNDPSLNLNGSLTIDGKEIVLQGLNGVIESRRLNPFMEFPVKGLTGELKVDISKARFQQNGVWQYIQGSGVWNDAKVYYFNNELVLGDIEFGITTDEANNINLQIIENKGAMDLQGQFQLTPEKNYHLDFTTSQQLPDNISTWVKRLGKLENNRYRVIWKGKLK